MKVTLALLSAVAVALARPSALSGSDPLPPNASEKRDTTTTDKNEEFSRSLEKRYWFEECRALLTKDPKTKCDPGRDDDDPAAPWRLPDYWKPPAEREKKKAEDAENEKKKTPEQRKADKDKDDQLKARYEKNREERRARAKISDEELTRRDRETEEREKKWYTCRVALLKNRDDPCDPGPLPPFEYTGWPKEIKEIFNIMRDREKAREDAEWQKMSPEERKKKEQEAADKKAAGEAAVEKAKKEMDDRAAEAKKGDDEKAAAKKAEDEKAASKKADDEKAADKKADDGKSVITKAEFVKTPVKKAGWLEARNITP